jgi:hypothetical protein
MQGGDLSRFASLNTQQTFGSARQAGGYYQYVYTSQDFDNAWGNIYTSTLENNDALQKLSDANGYHAYSGVARILRAYTLQLTVDTWGDVPYSDAFKGAENLKPKYDNGQALYDTIANLLTAAISLLNDPDAGDLVPGGEDVIYGGDADKWIQFAHAIRARLFLHQSKGNATMAASALTEISAAFTANDESAQYIFGETETSANPWYQFNQQRAGDISFSGGGVAEKMIALHDPRLPILIDTTAASGGDGLLFYGVINSPVEFITYDELLFRERCGCAGVLPGGDTSEYGEAGGSGFCYHDVPSGPWDFTGIARRRHCAGGDAGISCVVPESRGMEFVAADQYSGADTDYGGQCSASAALSADGVFI